MQQRLKIARWIVLSACLIGCRSQPAITWPPQLENSTIDDRDPAADVREAIRRKDFHFIATRGISIDTPGVPGGFPEIDEKYGVRFIEGSSDTTSIYDADAAAQYATIYNATLARHLRMSHEWKLSP